MSNVTNLNQFRKRRDREDARAKADSNAAKFGRTKAQRHLDEATSANMDRKLDGHKRDPQMTAGSEAARGSQRNSQHGDGDCDNESNDYNDE
ncbi:hypothetical protein AQS8620_01681 [Aquimixticola soesokkakensis]|uniref:DUF4169 domain-containing protein n=1 Tax=Aquimixticola soesokkakensis TaxID=1519096 RepID=A0A1Y5SPC8_9RHOB|nr:DUF4169 family protein [Aquimixticola soesokkakensis]SLN42282.1 hypothetical protein AQS8620_01681 [Aquimixticola soesokkakensis]